MNKYARTTRDKSHVSIMNDLRSYGYSVADMASVGNSFPDLLVSSSNATVVIEIKERTGSFYVAQLEFISTWKGYAGFASTLDDARALMADPAKHCLTQRDKDRIAQIAVRCRAETKAKNPQIRIKKFEQLLNK